MKKIISTLALSAVAATASFAAVSPDPIGNGDIFIGFYATGGVGVDRGLVINLGAFQTFDNRDGATFSLSRVATADLVSVYGASWNTRTDLVWTVTGSVYGTGELDGLSRNTVFASSPRASIGDAPDPITGNNSASQGTNDRTSIQSIAAGYNSATTTVDGGYAVIQEVGSVTNAFRDFQLTTPTALFGPLNDNDTNGTNISDFYGLVPTDRTIGAGNAQDSGWTTGTNYLGYFTLDATGLTFTASGSAIPEPSSFAALGGLAALGFAASRRRRAAQA